MRLVDRTLLDDFEAKGVWWLPQRPENKVEGDLRYKAGDRITLELIGTLRQPNSRTLVTLEPQEIILGVTESGDLCTLVDTFESRYNPAFLSEVSTSNFIVNRLYVGKHFASREQIRFHSMAVCMTYLKEWLGKSPIEVEGLASAGPRKIVLPYRSKEVFRTTVKDGDFTLSFHSRLGMSFAPLDEVSCRHFTVFQIEPMDSHGYAWYDECRRRCEILFSLLVGEPVFSTTIVGLGEEIQIGDRVERERIAMFPVLRETKIKKDVHPAEMPAPLSLIEDRIAGIIQTWFSKASALDPVYTLTSAVLYSTKIYLESEFLILMQALESFHRREYGGLYVSQEEYAGYYDQITRTLPTEMPQPLKDKLKNQLKYGNEWSLKRRILSLVDTLSEDTRGKIAINIEEFVRRLVDTRNYLTHYDEDLKEKAIQGSEGLLKVNQKLRGLLTLILLRLVGIQEEQCAPRLLARLEA